MGKQPNAIEKALEILMAFSPKNNEMGTVYLSKKTGFHVNTANRILKILAGRHFLVQNPITKKYTLGPSVSTLCEAIAVFHDEKLLTVAIPCLNGLCNKVEETILLEIISNMTGFVLYEVHPKRPVILRTSTGREVPLHASAGCKSMLAFFEPHEIDEYFQKKMKSWTKNTITQLDKLKHHLSEVKKNGIAFSQEEIDIGLNGMGMPIFDQNNRPVASVVVTGPSSRVKCTQKSRLAVELKKTVTKISSKLFHPDSMKGLTNS